MTPALPPPRAPSQPLCKRQRDEGCSWRPEGLLSPAQKRPRSQRCTLSRGSSCHLVLEEGGPVTEAPGRLVLWHLASFRP